MNISYAVAGGFAALVISVAAGVVVANPYVKTLENRARASEFEKEMNNIPSFRIIREHNQTVQATVVAVKEKLERGEINEIDAVQAVTSENIKAFMAYAAITSDKAIIEYAKMLLDAIRVLHRKNPQLCADFVHNGTSLAAANALSEEQQAPVLGAMFAVVEGAITAPQVQGSPHDVMQALSLVFQEFGVADDPRRVFQKMHDPDPEKVCNNVESFYGLILWLPPHDADLALRAVFSGRLVSEVMENALPESNLWSRSQLP
jgi:hypothetical protein